MKGPHDRLSSKQVLWLGRLSQWNQEAHVCWVKGNDFSSYVGLFASTCVQCACAYVCGFVGVCSCVCICVWVFFRLCVRMCVVCGWLCRCVSMWVWVGVSIWVFVHVCVCICVGGGLFVRVYVFVCGGVYMCVCICS